MHVTNSLSGAARNRFDGFSNVLMLFAARIPHGSVLVSITDAAYEAIAVCSWIVRGTINFRKPPRHAYLKESDVRRLHHVS